MFSGKAKNKFFKHNTASLLAGGKPYFDALLHLIQTAQNQVHLQVYIFESDETGEIVKNALINASSRGVNVFLMLDGFGSSSLPSKFIEEIKIAGIHFRWFGPLFSGTQIHIGRRMHHKVAVADYRVAIVGGINIGNRYNEINDQPPWLDFAVHTEGEIAFQLHNYCAKKWKGFNPLNREIELKNNLFKKTSFTKSNCDMRIRVNDRLNRKSRIVYSYKNAINHAKENIIIVGGYFLPGNNFIRLLQKASMRGVKITLLIGAQSDVWLAQNALHYLYRKLIQSNIEIFEYTKAPVHGKVIVTDKKFVSLGSYDLNLLSSFINLELNLDINNETFAANLYDSIQNKLQKNSNRINERILKKREGIFKRLKQWIAFRLLRIIFFITLFVSNKKEY